MSLPTWLEVSLIVDGELAEAVAEVLARFVQNGVVVESTAISPDPNGEGAPTGPLRVCGYLPADEHMEETRQRLEEALWYLGRISPLPPPEFRLIQEANWVEAWKQHYQPIPIGQRLVILPAWHQSPPGGRIPIYIDPGMAFGTGTHPTTQLCLQVLENSLLHQPKIARGPSAETPSLDVIDVGCGSGILSIAAIKLGANRALGVDIDQQAIESARQNAINNQVSDRLELGLGSIRAIREGNFSIKQAHLVFANILAPVLIRMLDEELAGLIAPGGFAILSGILTEQESSILEACRANHLNVRERHQMEDWLALVIHDDSG